jgi:hypothetical protein
MIAIMPDPTRRPVCLSMLICDEIYEDPLTHRRTLLGVMSILPSATVPFVYRPLAVHFSLIQLNGTHHFRLVIEHEASREVIFQTPPGGEMLSCDDPNQQIDGNLAIGPTRFPHAGFYRFTLLIDEVPVAQRRLEVQIPSPRRPPPPASPLPPRSDRDL